MAQDAVIAESSPAIENPNGPMSQEPAAPVSRQQRQELLKALNAPAESADTSQTEEIDTSKSSASKDESAPAPEAGKSGPKGKLSISERSKQLEAENKTLSEQLARRKQLRADLEALEKPAAKTDAKADSSTPAAKTAEPDGRPVRPPKPRAEEFADWDKYQAALDDHEIKIEKHYEDLADWKADQKLKGYDEGKSRADKQRASDEKWGTRIKEAAKEHPDYLVVVHELSDKGYVTPTINQFASESDHGAMVLYRLGEDLNKAAEIAQMSPVAAMRALLEIESEFHADASKTAPKLSPRVSQAPRPERVLHGGTAPPDLEAQKNAALAAGDVKRYRQLNREQEAAARKTR